MQGQHDVKLTITEITSLWQQYIAESLDICIKKYILAHVEDSEVRTLIEHALNLSESHIKAVKTFFDQEKYPLPIGFSDEDVNVQAPRLFSDIFWLKYMQIMAANGMPNYALALTTSIRSDIRDYYTQCSVESMDLYSKSMTILLSKGLFVRPPWIPAPDGPEFMEGQSLLQSLTSNRRTLNGLEVSHLFFNLQKTDLAKALILGFRQVIQSKKIGKYMTRALDEADKHITIFSSLLQEDNIPVPVTWESEITNSTIPPFSDKLMMIHTALNLNYAIFYYGAALSNSMRTDLVAQYLAIIGKSLIIAEDASNILTDNSWLEQPPQTIDRRKLIKV